jgi:hypothetical protein
MTADAAASLILLATAELSFAERERPGYGKPKKASEPGSRSLRIFGSDVVDNVDTSLEGEARWQLSQTRDCGLCFCERRRYKGLSFSLPNGFNSIPWWANYILSFYADQSRLLPLPIMHSTFSYILTALLTVLNFVNAAPAPAPADLEERQSLNPTRNDLSGPCKPITVLFARGTVELGNVGLLAGVPFVNALGMIVGFSNVAVQGVDYPADIPGYLLGGSASGTKTLAGLLNTAASKCPDTQIVVGGYR